MDDLKEKLEKVKKQLKNLKKDRSGGVEEQADSLEVNCRKEVVNSASLYNTVQTLMKKLFTNEEILNSSVSGKAANTKTPAKPKFDTQKLDVIRKICLDLHGQSNITDRIQAVKKSVKREQANKK